MVSVLPDLACFTLSLPGHLSGSPLPPGRVELDDLVRDAREQLDELGIDQAHFVGNSLGAWVALRLAQEGRAISIVAFAPAGGWVPAGAVEWSLRLLFRVGKIVSTHMIGVGRSLLHTSVIRRLVLRPVMENGHTLSYEEALEILSALAHCELLAVGRLRTGAGMSAAFEGIDVPVVVSWSAKDRVLRPHRPATKAVREGLASAQFVSIPDAGHVPMFDFPDACAAIVRACVRDAVAGAQATA